MPVVPVKFLRHLIHVAVWVGVVNQHQIQLAVLLRAEKLSLIAQVVQELAISGDSCINTLKFAHQRALGLFVFRVEDSHLRVQQIAEVK